MATPAALTEEGYEMQFGTNHIGHAVILRLLKPVMLRTANITDGGDVRYVAVSSSGHNLHPEGGIQFDKLRTSNGVGTWRRYGQSKLANILYCKAMAKRFNAQITSVAIHPGLAKTGLMSKNASAVLRSVNKLTDVFYRSAETGAYNTLWAATVTKDRLENGAYYEPVGKKGSTVAKVCGDDALADKLWEWTEENELEGLEELWCSSDRGTVG